MIVIDFDEYSSAKISFKNYEHKIEIQGLKETISWVNNYSDKRLKYLEEKIRSINKLGLVYMLVIG